MRVFGTHVAHGPQDFALVLTGHLTELPLEACSGSSLLCPRDCSGRGTCDAERGGKCVDCSSGFAGPACDLPTVVLEENAAPLTVEAQHGTWTYLEYPLPTDGSVVTALRFEFRTTAGDPDYYIHTPAQDEFPTLVDYSYINNDCDANCGVGQHPSHEATIDIKASDLEQARELGGGSFKVGVFPYCCENASFTAKATATRSASGPGPGPTSAAPTPVPTLEPAPTPTPVMIPGGPPVPTTTPTTTTAPTTTTIPTTTILPTTTTGPTTTNWTSVAAGSQHKGDVLGELRDVLMGEDGATSQVCESPRT